MRKAFDYLREELNIIPPEGNLVITMEWFCKNDLPFIVRCTSCSAEMTLPSAYINVVGECFCAGCAELEEE